MKTFRNGEGEGSVAGSDMNTRLGKISLKGHGGVDEETMPSRSCSDVL